MVFAFGLLTELPAKSEKPPKPLKYVACAVKYPCSCCCLSFIIAIITSWVGFRILAANSGPLGPFKIGSDYPNYDLIARNSDTMVIARETSAIALLGEPRPSARRGWGRRMDAADEIEIINDISASDDFADLLVGKMVGEEYVQRNRRQLQSASNSTAVQPQQSVTLAIALLVVGARDGVTNLYDDEGIAQLCRFRHGLMDAEPTWPEYCLLQRDPSWNPFEAASGSEPPRVCNRGTDGLGMFFGDATYDIESIDTAVFATPDFDAIVTAFSRRNFAALAAFPPANVAAVSALYGKLFGYLTGPWSSSTHVCDMTKKKNLATVLSVLAHIREAPSLGAFNGLLNQYFDRNFNVSNPVTRYTKGFYMYGAPLAGFSDYIEETNRADQDAQYQLWWSNPANPGARGPPERPGFRSLYPEGPSELWPTGQPTILNTKLLLSEILIVLIGDGLRAIAPIILVTLIVWLQTGSLFIALVTITEIILSLTAAIFITSAVLQIKWVAFQNALALYIVLAIGADDVFVFMDAYKQSFYKGNEVNQTLAHRMSWVYRRAGLAMLITSLTTCSAFVAAALSSPIPDLQNFGIFAACVIFLDYALVMSFLCANCIIFHNYFEMKPGLCCACCDGCMPNWKCAKGGCVQLCTFSGLQTTTVLSQETSKHEGGVSTVKKPAAVVFFEDTFPFNLVVKNVPTRLTSIFICLACLVAGAISATGIEPQKSAEDFLPENNPFQRYQTVQSNFESSNFDTTVEINMVWGFRHLDPLNQDGVNLIFDADFKGTPNYASGFELTPAAQNAILASCDILHNANATKISIDADTGNSTVMTACFMSAFQRYRIFRGLPFPVPTAAEAATALAAWVIENDESVPENARGLEYEDDVGWRRIDNVLTLAFAKIRAFSKLNTRAFLSAPQTRVYYNAWQAVLAQINTLTESTPIGSAFQIAGLGVGRGNKWIYMTVQEAYVRMAITGAGIGLAIALCVLLLATRNIIVSIACMFTITSALVCVVGTIVAMGWQLGSNESLCIMVLTGFAVDYVVHLSHAYMESPSADRLERTHDAIRDLGISVFWGMLTSIFAAVTLATCQIQSLSKFGVFFALTISYAYLWSVLFLMPLLACIGPQPKAGSVSSSTYKTQESSADGTEIPVVPPTTKAVGSAA